MKQPLSESLASRTFIGLLLAQFTATFNDQAIHVVAIFYAVDMLVRFAQVRLIDDKAVVAIVTACFITPFLLFSSYAGPLGDRFSKRSVVVFWKGAEVLMMGLAFLGLGLPHLFSPDDPRLPTVAVWSAGMVIATVFLMGMHSTFFVPAKLGAMPEILHPAVLSRGNGVLEGTSFTAQILGTSAGGILYSLLKGEVTGGKLVMGQDWMIGALLFGLALVGTASALLMRPIPAAAPGLNLSWHWWRPLRDNLSILWKSRPLTLSVTGIAFCVFMTLFLRQTLFYQAELTKELRVAQAELASLTNEPPPDHPATALDRMLARVLPPRLEKAAQEPELRVALLFAVVGLGVGLGSIVAGYVSGHRIELGLVPIGALTIVVCTLVPCVLRHAPGLFVLSLFGIGCGAGFYLVPLYTQLQHRAPRESKGNVVSASNFLNVVGFYLRTGIWIRARGHNALRTIGIENMPTDGPVVLLANCHVFPAALDLVAAVDRYVRLVFVEERGAVRSRLQKWAQHAGMIAVPALPEAPEWARAEDEGEAALRKGEMVALTINQAGCAAAISRVVAAWQSAVAGVVVLPVCCTSALRDQPFAPHDYPRVIIGPPLPPGTSLESALAAIDRLTAASASE
ncbi:MAG: MFS transporter [Planctomycetia bacterium]|nr:MFS transporter [Planctomycetia bacterium]